MSDEKRMLKVKDLIKGLSTLDQEAYVALSADTEGNAYSIMMNSQYVIDEVLLKSELGSQASYFLEEDVTGGFVEDFYGKKVAAKDLVKAVVLIGTN